MGQQEKAFRMLQSRKIVFVKALKDSPHLYVKAMIKKSYGTEMRPAVLYFNGLWHQTRGIVVVLLESVGYVLMF